MIPDYVQNWEIMPKTTSQTKAAPQHAGLNHPTTASRINHSSTRSTPEAPRTAYIRDENRPRTSSLAHKSLEPILTNKKTYITEEGFPRTEYFWRHPPVFEDAQGRTQPVYMDGFLNGQLNSPFSVTNSDIFSHDSSGAKAGGSEEELLFRDSGYGAGFLPGLKDSAPMSGPLYGDKNTGGVKKVSSNDSGIGSSQIEEAKLAKIEHELDEAEAASRRAGSNDEERRTVVGGKLQAIEKEMSQVRI